MSETQVTAVERRGEVTVVRVLPESLDVETTSTLQEDVLAAAMVSPKIPVVLDLSGVKTIPSVALSMLVVLLSELKKTDQKLILVGVQSMVRESLAITRLNELLEIRDDVESVLDHLRGAAATKEE